ATAGRGGPPAAAAGGPGAQRAGRPNTAPPRRNRYALFAGNLLHGVLDARGRTPGRPMKGPPGRMRVTLVVNFWDRRPTDVPTWAKSGLYRSLRSARPG